MQKSNLFELKTIYILILLSVVALIVYANSFKNPFIWDQEVVIINNPVIRSWQNLPHVFKTTIFGKKFSSVSYYRPIATVSYMFDYSIWKLDPFGYHLSSTLFHLCNSILIFFLLIKLKFKRHIALILSLIFVVHSVNTEVVDYSIRGDLLGTLFSLLTIIFYIDFKQGKKVFAPICIGSYLIAVLSKEWVVVVPVIIFIYSSLFCNALAFQNTKEKKNLAIKLDFVLTMLFLIAAAYFFTRLKFIIESTHSSLSLIAYAPLWHRILTVPRILLTYMGLMILPMRLHMEYHFVTRSLIDISIILGVPFLIVISYIFVKYAKKTMKKNPEEARYLMFFALWFLIGLAPFYNILVTIHSTVLEHWVYFPGIGFLALLGMILSRLFEKISHKTGKIVFITAILLLMCYYCAYTVTRNHQWGDALRLYQHDLELEPRSFVLYNNVGVIHFRNNNLKEAKEAFTKAIEVSPNQNYEVAHNNLGVIYQNEGDLETAEKLYIKSIQLNNYELAYENLSRIYLMANRLEDAISVAGKGGGLYPLNTEVHYNLALGYFYTKQYDAAKRVFLYIQNKLQPNYKDVAKYLGKLDGVKIRWGQVLNLEFVAVRFIAQRCRINPTATIINSRFKT